MPFVPDKPASRFVPDAPPAAVATPPTAPAAPEPSLAMAPVGGLETLLHHITGALAPIPGMLAGSGAAVGKLFGANVDPNKVQADTEHALTYQPISDSGKAGLAKEGEIGAAIAPVVKPVTDVVNAGIDKTGAAAPYVRAAGKGALTALQFAAPGAGKAAGEALLPEAAVEGAAKPVVGTGADAVQTGRAAGFKYTPGGVASRDPAAALAGDLPSSGSVTAANRREINLHNQARATELAGEHLGVKGATTLPTKAFEDAKVPHYGTYTDTGAALGSGLQGSPDLISTLEAHLADTSPTQLKGAAVAQTNRILNAAKSGNLSGPQMVKDISWLRANGGRSVAGALESEMETQLAATPAGAQQLGKFRDARTSLAQINDLQRAAAKGGGQISLPHLVAIDAKNPNLLTGTPKLLAQSAAAAPQDFRLPSGVEPGTSPLSKGVLQKIPLIGTAAHAALHGVEKAGSWAAKKLVPGKFDPTSDAFQNRFGREATPTEASYFPGFGKRPAPPSKAFELEAPAGAAGGPPQQAGMSLPEGRPAAPRIELAPPEGELGEAPSRQLGMEIAQGRPAAPKIELAPPEGELGAAPSRQLGMEIAQGRPLDEQHLALKPTEGTIEPHQPSLLGHEGTPEGGSRKPKAKKHGKD